MQARIPDPMERQIGDDVSIDAIASAVGLSPHPESRPGFIRAFERQFGVSPIQYRQSHRDVVANADIKGADVTLRDIEPFRILARRYVGDIFKLRSY